MEGRNHLKFMLAVSAAVLLGSGLAVLVIEGVNVWSMVMLAAVVILAVVALAIVVRSLKDIRSGYPLRDERSEYYAARAGNYSFYVSMYLVLGIAVALILFEDRGWTMSNSELLFIVVAVMGSVHIVLSKALNGNAKGSSE